MRWKQPWRQPWLRGELYWNPWSPSLGARKWAMSRIRMDFCWRFVVQ
ncbi:UNVERIFIED_CONTAM: hypothetical protein GTU68_061112 [Idotea baltica]|nr:hypothetical protein [Idotea baltica]